MEYHSPAVQAGRPKTDWMSIFQLVFSLAVFFCLAVIGLVSKIGKNYFLSNNLTKSMAPSLGAMLDLFAWASLLLGLFAFVSIIASARKIDEKSMPNWMQSQMLVVYGLIFIWFIIFLTGSRIFKVAGYAETFMPLFSAMGIFIAGLVFMRVGIGRAWGRSPQRSSGLLTFGFAFTTPLILIAESSALVLAGSVFGLSMLRDPRMQNILKDFPILLYSLQENAVEAQKMLADLASQPAAIAFVILLFVFLMPLIEELLKTFGVLLLKGRNLSPSDGLVAGIASGAGFGLLEGFLFAVQLGQGASPEMWVFFMLGRSAALLMHIFNGALNGWALLDYWQDRKLTRLIGIFLLTLFLHGLWNGLAISSALKLMDPKISGALLAFTFLSVFIAYILFTRKIYHHSIEKSYG
ncbi:MAG: PrsW family glutamic-type intramembrane protease [Anaerolineaceae bacterium]|nr:PrsW family glutamic-type intramembrane protease [Anaerolineaceae bacterium]